MMNMIKIIKSVLIHIRAEMLGAKKS